MRIKAAQAGLILRNVVVTEMMMKNQLAAHGKFNENTHVIDMDYDVLDVDDTQDDMYHAKLALTTKVFVKEGKETLLNFKIKHLGLLAAPKPVYETTDDFLKAVELNGLASLVSVARANISSITGIVFCQGNVTLPLINIFKLQKMKEEAKS